MAAGEIGGWGLWVVEISALKCGGSCNMTDRAEVGGVCVSKEKRAHGEYGCWILSDGVNCFSYRVQGHMRGCV